MKDFGSDNFSLKESIDKLATSTDQITTQMAEVANRGTKMGRNTVIIMGDSISQQIGEGDYKPSFSGTYYYFHAKGYFSWANAFLGQSLNLINNAGIGGHTTTQMVARFDDDVLGQGEIPEFLIVQGGINDLFQLTSSEVIISNLKNMYDKAMLNGIKVVACTICASDSLVAENKTELLKVNNWIKRYSKENPMIILCDWFNAISESVDTTAITALTEDGTHPIGSGAYHMGKVLYEAVLPYVKATNLLPNSNNDTENLHPNGMWLGANASQRADSWFTTTMDAVYTLSKTTEGMPLKIERQHISQTEGTLAFYYDLTEFEVGDFVYAIAEIKLINCTAFNVCKLAITCTGNPTYATTSLPNDVPLALENIENETIILKTPIMQIPLGTTALRVRFDFSIVGEYEVGRTKVTTII